MAFIQLRAFILLSSVLLAGNGLRAQDEPGCLDCHKAGEDSVVHAVFKTVHGSLNGGGSAACTSCHGPSEAHDRRGKKAPVDVSYGPLWTSDVEVRNASCQSCHDNGDQLLWVPINRTTLPVTTAISPISNRTSWRMAPIRSRCAWTATRRSAPNCSYLHATLLLKVKLIASIATTHTGALAMPRCARLRSMIIVSAVTRISAAHSCGSIRLQRRTAPCATDLMALLTNVYLPPEARPCVSNATQLPFTQAYPTAVRDWPVVAPTRTYWVRTV